MPIGISQGLSLTIHPISSHDAQAYETAMVRDFTLKMKYRSASCTGLTDRCRHTVRM